MVIGENNAGAGRGSTVRIGRFYGVVTIKVCMRHGEDVGEVESKREVIDVGVFSHAPPLQEFGDTLITSRENSSRRCKGNRIISTVKSPVCISTWRFILVIAVAFFLYFLCVRVCLISNCVHLVFSETESTEQIDMR